MMTDEKENPVEKKDVPLEIIPSEKKDFVSIHEEDFSLSEPEKLKVYIPATHVPEDLVERRQQAIRKHYNGHDGISAKLESEGRDGLNHAVMELVREILSESDNLAGNALIALEDGNLAGSSAISAKRAEVIEKALKAVQTKEMFEKERGIDVESPSMEVVWRYFLAKTEKTLTNVGLDIHFKDVFYKDLGREMFDWKKELKEEINRIYSIGKKK